MSLYNKLSSVKMWRARVNKFCPTHPHTFPEYTFTLNTSFNFLFSNTHNLTTSSIQITLSNCSLLRESMPPTNVL